MLQLFCTTKPTGKVTVLGLSLSYDIVKAPGGAIKVETNVMNELDDYFKRIINLPAVGGPGKSLNL